MCTLSLLLLLLPEALAVSWNPADHKHRKVNLEMLWKPPRKTEFGTRVQFEMTEATSLKGQVSHLSLCISLVYIYISLLFHYSHCIVNVAGTVSSQWKCCPRQRRREARREGREGGRGA
jgi:hypothetical protein